LLFNLSLNYLILIICLENILGSTDSKMILSKILNTLKCPFLVSSQLTSTNH